MNSNLHKKKAKTTYKKRVDIHVDPESKASGSTNVRLFNTTNTGGVLGEKSVNTKLTLRKKPAYIDLKREAIATEPEVQRQTRNLKPKPKDKGKRKAVAQISSPIATSTPHTIGRLFEPKDEILTPIFYDAPVTNDPQSVGENPLESNLEVRDVVIKEYTPTNDAYLARQGPAQSREAWLRRRGDRMPSADDSLDELAVLPCKPKN